MPKTGTKKNEDVSKLTWQVSNQNLGPSFSGPITTFLLFLINCWSQEVAHFEKRQISQIEEVAENIQSAMKKEFNILKMSRAILCEFYIIWYPFGWKKIYQLLQK